LETGRGPARTGEKIERVPAVKVGRGNDGGEGRFGG